MGRRRMWCSSLLCVATEARTHAKSVVKLRKKVMRPKKRPSPACEEETGVD